MPQTSGLIPWPLGWPTSKSLVVPDANGLAIQLVHLVSALGRRVTQVS